METKKFIGIFGIVLGIALIITGIVLCADKPSTLRALTADFQQQDDYYQYTYKSVSELVKGLSQQNKLLHIAVCALFFTLGAVILGNSFVNVFPHITLPPIFKKKQRGATRVVKQRVISK